MTESVLDDVNRRLLAALHQDPRQPMSELARRVGMSAPAVSERVARLERLGVITGYRVAELAGTLPQVTECYRITGEDCFLVKVHAATIQELEDTLDKFLMHGQTISSLVVSTPVAPRPLPVRPG